MGEYGLTKNENAKKLFPGQVVYVKEQPYRSNIINERTVEKIGRQYFYLDGYDCKFSLETMKDVPKCGGSTYTVYLSLQEIKDEVEFKIKRKEILDYLTSFPKPGPTLDQMRRVHAALFGDDNLLNKGAMES
jgi:hypothetical protein